jgi:geranylgeranyl transferase type-2 subunit beta
MTSSPYLDMLDALLRPGMAGLSVRFVESQVRFVAGCQQSDGGFRGREGGSDLYYTDFALRTLAWLAPGHGAFAPAAGYLARQPCPPHSVVECFNVLHTRRLLQGRRAKAAGDTAGKESSREHRAAVSPSGHAGCADADDTLDPLRLTEWLYGQILPSGGFARWPHDQRVSAYHTFLGALCFQMLGGEMPAIEDAARSLAALARPDGGYAELAGQAASQTSATAAATAFLLMHDALPEEDAARTARFLAAMQSADGGLKPHADVRAGDLLSTFTGLLSLWGLAGLDRIDLAAVARFLRGTAHPAGGFVSCPGDQSPDAEYTYYGVGTLALLRAWELAQ